MKKQLKNDEIAQIKKAVEICNQRDILLLEIEEYDEIINPELPSLDEYKKISFDVDAPKKLFLVLSIALGFAFTVFTAFYTENMLICWALGIGMMFALYHLVFKRLFYLSQKKDFDEYGECLVERNNALPALKEQREEVKNKLDALEKHMSREENCIIPQMYWDNANVIYFLIKNKRANDLTSALNVFENCMHQGRMENTAQESLLAQQIAAYNSQIAAENSAIAAENSRQAAINSGISAAFSIANYYQNKN